MTLPSLVRSTAWQVLPLHFPCSWPSLLPGLPGSRKGLGPAEQEEDRRRACTRRAERRGPV